MGRYLRFSVSVLAVLMLIMAFQNCGKRNSAQAQDIFVHFDDLQNTKYEIVHSDCSQNSECLFTLHTVDSSNTIISQKPNVDTPPITATPPSQSIATDPAGMYCDVLSASGFGDVYVSCPQEVQSEAGFYIHL